MVINISIHDSVKKNINAFELIIYVQEDFHKLWYSYGSKWVHTNENRFGMIKRRWEYVRTDKKIGKCKKKF